MLQVVLSLILCRLLIFQCGGVQETAVWIEKDIPVGACGKDSSTPFRGIGHLWSWLLRLSSFFQLLNFCPLPPLKISPKWFSSEKRLSPVAILGGLQPCLHVPVIYSTATLSVPHSPGPTVPRGSAERGSGPIWRGASHNFLLATAQFPFF